MSVRIVNGEVVRGPPTKPSGSSFGATVHSIHTAPQPQPGRTTVQGAGAPPPQPANAARPPVAPNANDPLEQLAGLLGIAGQVFVVPAVPFLGWRATPIPLVWGAAAGLVAVGVSLRAPEHLNTVLCGVAIALAGYVHMQSSGDPLPAQAR